MPKLKKVSVDVCTPGETLASLGTEITSDPPLCESFILSQTGMRFGVVIKPDDDFFAPHIVIDTRLHPDRGGRNRPENYPADPSQWHLLAEVYLDDCLDPEASIIVYLPWYVRAEERLLDSSITYNCDGETVERLWYFQEVGLENFVTTLSLGNPDAGDGSASIGEAASGAAEGILSEMMQTLKTERSKKDPLVAKPGQIRVELRRIEISGSGDPIDQPATNRQSQQTNLGEFNHLIEVGEPINVTFAKKRQLYKILDEEIYAKFVFNYRSVEQLKKMKLLQSEEHTRRRLENLVPFLRPLTFNEQAKSPELLPGSKEPFVKTQSPFKENDHGLMDQEVGESLLKDSSPTFRPNSKMAEPFKLPNLETGSLRPANLGGDKSVNNLAASVINSTHPTTQHAGGPGGDVLGCESNGPGGEYCEPPPEIDEKFDKEISFLTSGTKHLFLSLSAQAPDLRDSFNSDAGTGGNYNTETPTHLVIERSEVGLGDKWGIEIPTSGPSMGVGEIQLELNSDIEPQTLAEAMDSEEENSGIDTRDHPRIMGVRGVQLAGSMKVSAVSLYKSSQITKRVYSSEDDGDIKEPDIKRPRRIKSIAADTSVDSEKI